MKRNDLILIIALLAVSLILYVLMNQMQKNNTNATAYAVVTIDGVEYARYPLNEDVEEDIVNTDGQYNKFIITDGEVTMVEASCPDKICVRHSSIKYDGQTIVCLPNALVIEIVGGVADDVDTSTN